MNQPVRTRRPKAISLAVEDLLSEVGSGRLRVPRFQRPLRWRTKQIVEFFDSLYRGFPIGDLLLAEGPGDAATLTFGPVVVTAADRPDAWFIVDGQQRVTSLVGALLHPKSNPYGDLHAVWFDLEDETFHRLDAASAPAAWLPINLVADSVDLLTWLNTWALRKERPDLVKRAMELSKALREYAIPTYILDGSDEAALRLIFKRVNTSGVEMKESEVFDALHGSAEQRPLADACTRLEQEGFGRFDPDHFERTVRVVSGDLRRRDEDQIDAAVVKDSERAVARTIAFLRGDAGVPHISLLPYRMAMFVLARYFRLHPDPSPRALQLLARWVWRGALSGVHASSTDQHIERLCGGMDRDAEAAARHLLEHTPSDFSPLAVRDRWNARFAASRLFALGLVALEPQQLSEDGATPRPWESDSISGWSDLSSIVHSPLHSRSTPRCERMLLTAAGNKLDATSWRQLPSRVPFENEQFWRSHAIDRRAYEALCNGSRLAFAEARARSLEERLGDLFRGRAGAGQSDRISINHLTAHAREVAAG